MHCVDVSPAELQLTGDARRDHAAVQRCLRTSTVRPSEKFFTLNFNRFGPSVRYWQLVQSLQFTEVLVRIRDRRIHRKHGRAEGFPFDSVDRPCVSCTDQCREAFCLVSAKVALRTCDLLAGTIIVGGTLHLPEDADR